MPKILGLVWNPTYNGKHLHENYGWTNPYIGMQEAVDAINFACGDLYTLEIQDIPTLAMTRSTYGSTQLPEKDGSPYAYPVNEWAVNWMTYGGRWDAWPNGGQLHVGQLLQQSGLVERINNASVDEVWLASPPVPAPFEGALLHPLGDATAYTTHDTHIGVPGLQRRCVLHHAQMENWNLVHNYWHRVEAILAHIWTRHVLGYCDWDFGGMSMQDVQTYAQLFTMTDLCRRGEAQVGSCHFMPNSKLGYVGNMEDAVPSGAHLWLDYPNGFPLDLNRKDRYQIVSGATWENFSPFEGSVNEYVWQLYHVPRGQRRVSNAPTTHSGRWTDWWKYIVDTNNEYGIDAPSLRPTVNQEPPYPLPLTKYGSKYVMRVAPRPNDPESGGVYTIKADGVLTDQVTRKQKEHDDISLETIPAKLWVINGPNWVHEIQGEDGAMVAQYTKEQLAAEIAKLHAPGGQFANCPAPNRIEINQTQDYVLHWDALGQSQAMNEQQPLVSAILAYRTIYGLIMVKYCGTVVVPPVVVPPVPPVPPPTTIDAALQKWKDAYALEKKYWDEYVRLLKA